MELEGSQAHLFELVEGSLRVDSFLPKEVDLEAFSTGWRASSRLPPFSYRPFLPLTLLPI
jgi:hypothetical protein